MPLRDTGVEADPVTTAAVLLDRLSQLLAERLLFACHDGDSTRYLPNAQVLYWVTDKQRLVLSLNSLISQVLSATNKALNVNR